MRTYLPNTQHTFMVCYKDNTTNEVIHYVWITELTDLFDTEAKQATFTDKEVNDYYTTDGSNGNAFLIDEINDVLEQQHELEIIEITDIRD